MRLRVGTSGFSYKQWRGSFYPADLKPEAFLRFYADQFASVEINNTFYRMPDPGLLGRWAGETPADFVFVLKASRRITHDKRLADAESLAYFLEAAAALGGKLGPLLFQLPPHFKKDSQRLAAFLALIPKQRAAAFEFRHASWFDAEVAQLLREHRAALCLADTDETPIEALTLTADWGYVRLRRAAYDDAALDLWAARLQQAAWREAFVFFKHEDAGVGPALARRLLARF